MGYMGGHLTDLKNLVVCLEWDKQEFNFRKYIFAKSFDTMSFQVLNLIEFIENQNGVANS
jgi:hypothetical protein